MAGLPTEFNDQHSVGLLGALGIDLLPDNTDLVDLDASADLDVAGIDVLGLGLSAELLDLGDVL
ncbi:MAG: hypothetical protein ACREDO_12385 [Methyloceanibacter sp.]